MVKNRYIYDDITMYDKGIITFQKYEKPIKCTKRIDIIIVCYKNLEAV